MPTDGDKVWQAYSRNVKRLSKNAKSSRSGTGVVPLPSREGLGEGLSKQVDPSPAKAKDLPRGKSKLLHPLPQAERNPSFDRSLEKKLRAGDIEIDGRIDLHGMRQEEAYAALGHFIAKQVKAGRRCLLVITGKGKENKGVLRTSLTGWLGSLPEAARILGIRKAAIKHGGDGAFYVILRKKRLEVRG